MLGVSVLAGFGFDAAAGLVRRPSRRTWTMSVLPPAAFALFAVLLAVWLRTWGGEAIVRASGDIVKLDIFQAYLEAKIGSFLLLSLVGAAFLALAALKPMSYRVFMAVALCLLVVDLLPFAARFKVSQPADEILPRSRFVESLPARTGKSRIVKYAADVLPASTPTLIGIDDIHGYNALNLNHYIEVLGAVDSTVVAVENAALRRRIGPLSSREALGSKLLDMMNAAYILTAMRIEGGVGPVRVNNEGVLPRAYLVGGARSFGTYDEVLEYMKTEEFDPRREILIVGESGAEPDSVGTGSGVVISTYKPQEVVMEVRADRDCYLFMSDTYYPGWRAYVDGNEAPLLRANYAFRGLAVSEGRHEIRMVFESASFRIGTILSIAGLVLLAVLLVSRSAAPSL